ncbi:MAG: GNAT family N-acetyltransferase [Pyrinomonadaceae bacterium]|nr:GNAT family N-acetyltransferase [Phycisphaerales bacterium]
MPLHLIKPTAAHIPALARICFEAFGTLHDRHAIEKDFDSIETSEMLMGMFVSRPDMFGVAAQVDGAIVGSNFLQLSDAVAAVGPISVSPGTQASGVGKSLMIAVLDEARKRGVQQVRLQQEAVNTVSLSLYTKLGFDWREACALMRTTDVGALTPSRGGIVRPLTINDLPAIQRVSTHHYHSSRHNECEIMLRGGFPAVALERDGIVTGYFIPGFLGHGFAQSPDDLACLIGAAMQRAPLPFHKILVPLGQQELYRTLMSRGARAIKLFNYMTVGPYTPPLGAWLPSVGC